MTQLTTFLFAYIINKETYITQFATGGIVVKKVEGWVCSLATVSKSLLS